MQLITRWGKLHILAKGTGMLFKSKLKSAYVSEIDQFLQVLQNMPGVKSNARLEEEQKYQRIAALRDTVQTSIPEQLPWKDF
jgi:hypothetical protein